MKNSFQKKIPELFGYTTNDFICWETYFVINQFKLKFSKKISLVNYIYNQMLRVLCNKVKTVHKFVNY